MRTLVPLLVAGAALVFYSTSAVADDVEGRLKLIELGLQEKLDWTGEIETTLNANQSTPPSQSSPQDAVVRAHLRPKLEIEKNYSFTTNLLLRADSGNSTRNTVRLDEAFATAKLNPDLTFRAGKILYNWGNDSIFNPTDILNPYDYYDFYHVDKLGVIAADVNYVVSNTWSVDAGVIPIFQPSLVSDPTSRWINYSAFISQAVIQKIALPANLPPNYTIPFDLQQRSPKFPQPFIRATYKGLFFDAAAAYTYRYNPNPQIVLVSSNIQFDAINAIPTGTITGTPYYQHEHLFAYDMTVPTLGSIFFLNSTLSLPDAVQSDIPSNNVILSNLNAIGLAGNLTNNDIDNARRSSVAIATLGVKRDWSKFHAYLQYARIWYLHGKVPESLLQNVTNGTGVNPSDVYDFFSGTFIPGFSWECARKFNVKAGAVVNTKNTGVVAESGLEYRFTDGFRATLAYDYITGKAGTLLSQYAGNSRVSFDMNLVF